jgi:trigger factor
VKSTAENLSPTRVRLSVEVPFAELKPSLDKAYKEIGGQIRVPGFRPGKVPARIIDQRVGRAAVIAQAMEDAVPRSYLEALREHDVRALGQPDYDVTTDVTTMGEADNLEFTAEVDIRPDIAVPDLEGVPLTVDDVEVSDDDVASELDALRERFGNLKGVERPVQDGDFVSLDLSATVDGEPVEGMTRRSTSHRVGSGDLIDGLDEALLGHDAGETVTFGAAIEQGEHAGAEAEVSATINSVKEQELPELDDDFAQLASEFDTIDELRADARERIAKFKAMAQGAQARDMLVDHLVATVDFPLPESAVKAEVDYREHDIVHSLNHDDAMYEKFLEAQGKNRESFQSELREEAEKSVRVQFLLDAIAEKNDTQVGDAELTEYLVRQAARYGMAPQEFANQIMQGGNLPAVYADVRRNKALADVLEHAAITDASGNTVDLTALAGGVTAAADAIDDVLEAAAEDAVDEAFVEQDGSES